MEGIGIARSHASVRWTSFFCSEDSTSPVTKFFWEVVNTGVAIATEIYALGFYFPLLYVKGRGEPFQIYGLNPSSVNDEEAELPAVLFLHGDKHNQSGVLPLAAKIEAYREQCSALGKKSDIGPVFTVNLDYDDDHPEVHQQKLAERISSIQEIYRLKGKTLNLILVGHSKGAIEAADFAYCKLPNEPQENIEIKKVISLAGRLQVIPSKYRPCPKEIEKQVRRVTEAILSHPEIPLYNIVAGKDWIMEPEAAYLNKDPGHSLVVENRSHLGVLLSSKALDQVVEWLKQPA